MHNLQIIDGCNISEIAAANEIFNACRANETRENKDNVKFQFLPHGEHQAALYAPGFGIVATAVVDKFDV